jgi:hypothetical protein
MFPEYPNFKALEFDDLNLVSDYLKKDSRNICELSLPNIFVYKDVEKPAATLINKKLCLLISPPDETPYFLEPLGSSNSTEIINICLKHAGRISRASENFVSRIPADAYNITPLRGHFDYVYLAKELVELKGRKFDGKRNHIKNFTRRFPDYELIPLDSTFKKQALKLFSAWFEVRKESRFFPRLTYTSQTRAIETAFSYFKELKLIGGALLAEKDLKGFILGSAMNPETISVHFQYAHPDLPGAAQTLLRQACIKIFSKFTYVNLEQDLGIPGLRKAKLSYHPLKLEKKFEIKPIQKERTPA